MTSYALESSLRYDTFAEGNNNWYPPASITVNYQSNTVFSKFFEVIIPYNGECFIPILGLSDTLSHIQNWLDTIDPTQFIKFSYPLYVGGEETRKTADSIIKSINRCSRNRRLAHIKTCKGLDYYGGQGLIFDELWNPFMVCGFIINVDGINKTMSVVRPVCYVSPTVFVNGDILSKAIVKKVIPYISLHGISVHYTYRGMIPFNNTNEFRNVTVTIAPIKGFIVSPTKPGTIKSLDGKPDTIENLDNSIWEFLRKNISDLICQ